MRRSELLLARIYSTGILVWLVLLIPHSESLRGSAVVLQAKAKAAEPKLEHAVDDDASNGTTALASNSTKLHLTGIPQIDYVHDPNLPRELNGHNLTNYPFYNAIPDEIDFKCDGLHDGFYASVPHKCQVYHHCLYGFRYDFLCANYTAFDQKTFICHFVSEVDCENSPKHYKRNEDLYKEATTSTTTTTTTTTTTQATTRAAALQPAGNGGVKHMNAGGRRRRPHRRRRPMYDYYYDDEEYVEPEYYDDEAIAQNHRRPSNRKQNKDLHDHHETKDTQDSESVDYEDHQPEPVKTSVRTSNNNNNNNPTSTSVYERPRSPPKIRRPVPKSERDKYDYVPKASSYSTTIAPTEKPTTASPHAKKSSTSTPQASYDEYYEDEEYEYEQPRPSVKTKHQHSASADYDFPTAFEDTHRYVARPHRNRQPARKRTDMYDDYDTVKERPRMNRRKEYTRHDDRPRSRPMYRNKNRQDESGGGYSVKKRPVESEYRRRPEKQRPTYDDDYYYDEEEEVPPKRNRRPSKTTEKPTKVSTTKQPKTERTTTITTTTTTESTTTPTRPSKPTIVHSSTPQRNAKASSLENDTTKENEIPTTENISARTTQKYKTIKVPIINNVVREDAIDDIPADYPVSVSTEETRSSSTHSRPVTTVVLKAIPSKSELTSKRPLDEIPSKTITTIRHFVIAPPARKPSHYGFMNAAPIPVNMSSPTPGFREEVASTNNKLPEQTKMQQQQQQHEFYSSRPTQYIKIPVSMSLTPQINHSSSYHPSTAFGGFYIPIEQPKSKQAKPVEEQLGENLNAISNGIHYSNAFESTKSQPYRQQQAQDQRLYTNALSFPQRPPSTYDITAPGPSAPAEETNSAENKRYSEVPTYTANADYDVTYNDALQPSTLHPVRRFPSTTFYIQTQPRRQTSEYAFNESAFSTLNRSQQNRYGK